jgi:hypothetical protein
VWSLGRGLRAPGPSYARVGALPTAAPPTDEGDGDKPGAPLGSLVLTVAPQRKGETVVKRVDPATSEQTSGEVQVEEVVEVSPLTALVAVLAHTRDASLLILGGSVLHIATNTVGGNDDSKLKDCIFFSAVPLVVLAVLWVATLCAAIARIFGMAQQLWLNTLLDFALVGLGSALQISTKPAGWAASAEDALWCSIAPAAGTAVGPVPLLVCARTTALPGRRPLTVATRPRAGVAPGRGPELPLVWPLRRRLGRPSAVGHESVGLGGNLFPAGPGQLPAGRLPARARAARRCRFDARRVGCRGLGRQQGW